MHALERELVEIHPAACCADAERAHNGASGVEHHRGGDKTWFVICEMTQRDSQASEFSISRSAGLWVHTVLGPPFSSQSLSGPV